MSVLSHMSPSFHGQNKADAPPGHAVAPCKYEMGFRGCSDSAYGGFGKLCVAAGFAVLMSLQFYHVGNVLNVRPEPEMAWVDASSVRGVPGGIAQIATVKYVHPLWDRSNVEFPGEPVRIGDPLAPASFPNAAIPRPHYASGPHPAFVWSALVYLRPKALFEGYDLSSHETSLGSNWLGTVAGSNSASVPDILSPSSLIEKARML